MPAPYTSCMRPPFLLLSLLMASPVVGETLYNGIVLPEVWPPKLPELTRAPLAVPPYLKQPPKVVPIDVGRQLFVDDFLIEETSLKRSHHHPDLYPGNPVIKPDKTWEGAGGGIRAGVFSDGVWFDPQDQLFKAWYWSGALSQKPLRYGTCMATSRDGIHWDKPVFDVVPGTNIVQADEDDLRRNSATVYLDQFEKDPARRFKMFRVMQGDIEQNGKKTHHNFIRLSFSPDGVHWTKAGDSTDTGDRSTVFYNAFRQRWVYSLREGGKLVSRCRGYYENSDPVAGLLFGGKPDNNHPVCWWVGADELDPAREDLTLRRVPERPWDLVPSQLYNLDAIAYESVMVGLFTIWRGQTVDSVKRPKINEVCVGYSRDGFHWSRPDRTPICGVSEDTKAWNYGNVQSAGGCVLVVGDKLHFYFGGTQWGAPNGSRHADPNCTGLATMRRDGFTSMDADASGGTLITRPVTFNGSHLFVNADVPNGKLTVEVLDESGKILAPYDRKACVTVRGDSTKREVHWDGAKDLSAAAGKPVRLCFHLTDGKLYSFWVSKDGSGESGGYLGAGGPGFSGPRDEKR